MKKGSGEQLHIEHEKLYRIYSSMKNRCLCPTAQAYELYGGRGITISEEFDTPKKFIGWALAGYSEGLELDREDNEGNYSPDNCRWVTKRVNARNRRSTLKEPCIYETNKKGRFLVRVYKNKKLHNLGTFASMQEAIGTRDNFTGTDKCGGYSH